MTMSDFFEQLPDFTDYELEKITDAIAMEIDKRAFARRKKLKEAFFKAWKDLEEDGATIFFSGEYSEAISLEDLEIE